MAHPRTIRAGQRFNWGHASLRSSPGVAGPTLLMMHSAAAVGMSQNGAQVLPYQGGVGTITPLGVAGKAGSSSSPIYPVFPNDIALVGANTYTLMAYACCSNSGIYSAFDQDNSSTRRFQFRVNNGKVEFIIFDGNNSVITTVAAPVAMSAAECAAGFLMMATVQPGRAAIVQGRTITETTIGTPGGIATGQILIGARATNTQAWNTGGISIVAAWPRTMSTAELASFASDPTSIIEWDDDFETLAAPASGGDGTATVSGAAATSAIGSVAAMAAAVASVFGVSATSITSPLTAIGSATAATSSSSASAQSSPVTSSGGASAVTAPAQAISMVGSVSPSASAAASPAGSSASGQAGTVSAQAGGSASVQVPGVSATGRAASVTASGSALASLVGVGAGSNTGSIPGEGSASAPPVGVSSYGGVGAVVAKGSASVAAQSISVTARASAITATGSGDGSATAPVPSATAIATAGQVSATGTRTGIEVNITEDMICKAVRDYIKSIAPPAMRALRTPVNKASMPNGAYVSFTPGARIPLSTNISNCNINSRSVRRPEQMAFQIDCYGEGSADLAETLNTLFRDGYAVELFARSGLEITPLYAGDIQQAPFTNDADQYEERYLFEINLQINSVIVVPQQTSNALNIDLISVDANFPPIEV